MSEVKWIKLTTSMFDDEKIKIIEGLPDKDAILIIWIKLLILAGKTNASGYLLLSQNIPYTDEMLATIFARPLNTVRLALVTFEQYGMIERTEAGFYIANWEKHQNVDGMDKIREQTRLRVSKHRGKMAEIAACNAVCNVTVTNGNATDIDIEEELEEELRDIYVDQPSTAAPKQRLAKSDIQENIVATYNQILCPPLPSVKILTDARADAIRRLLSKEFTQDDLIKAFQKVSASDFLMGRTKDPWTGCGFDWIIKRANLVKIMEGNYDNKSGIGPSGSGPKNRAMESLARAMGRG